MALNHIELGLHTILCKESDRSKYFDFNHPNYITNEWIIRELKKLDNKCDHCHVKMEFRNHGDYFIQKVDINLPYLQSNSLISCHKCKIKDKLEVEA